MFVLEYVGHYQSIYFPISQAENGCKIFKMECNLRILSHCAIALCGAVKHRFHFLVPEVLRLARKQAAHHFLIIKRIVSTPRQNRFE